MEAEKGRGMGGGEETASASGEAKAHILTLQQWASPPLLV